MVLQTDVAVARVGLVGDVEFVRRAVGPLVRLGPLVEVHPRDDRAVQLDAMQARSQRDRPCGSTRPTGFMAFCEGLTRS